MFLVSLRDGSGWHVLKNEIGNRYGRLTVVGFAEIRIDGKHSRRAYWTCLCDCGKTTVVSGSVLRAGTTVSCRCLVLEKAKARIVELNRTQKPKRDPKTGKFSAATSGQR